MTIFPTNSTIFVGSFVNLTCSVVVPSTVDVTVMVTITWTKPNGQQNNIIAIDIGTQGSQTITDYLFDRGQLGRYTCTAVLSPLSSNSTLRQSYISQYGMAQVFTSEIYIIIILYYSSSKLISNDFLHNAVSLNVSESPLLVSAGKQSFVLHCEVVRDSNNFSLPRVTIQWTYDLQDNDNLPSLRQLNNRQDLIFSPLKVSHAGRYNCTASMASLTKSETVDLRGKYLIIHNNIITHDQYNVYL